mmetsp:Transcript_4369/g.9055  ORF Transcript_4369/g.9055 Transcript_4369/m.9055 type:complete len:211 (-) Transcript_4369:223-855(-)
MDVLHRRNLLHGILDAAGFSPSYVVPGHFLDGAVVGRDLPLGAVHGRQVARPPLEHHGEPHQAKVGLADRRLDPVGVLDLVLFELLTLFAGTVPDCIAIHAIVAIGIGRRRVIEEQRVRAHVHVHGPYQHVVHDLHPVSDGVENPGRYSGARYGIRRWKLVGIPGKAVVDVLVAVLCLRLRRKGTLVGGWRRKARVVGIVGKLHRVWNCN